MSAPPPAHTPEARAILAWLDERVRALDVDESHPSDRAALSAFRAARRELRDRLPYVESGAICMVTPGVSHTSAERMLALYDDEGGGATDDAA